jgi:hypothetical protein
MTPSRLETVLRLIDEANARDPNRETWQGQSYPKELLYGMRMTEWLERRRPRPPEELAIAARGQHICRWEVPRDSYPADRDGYLRWRSYLYDFHATKVAELMERAGYEAASVDRVRTLIRKRGLKTDPDVQLIEDTACLVFLEYYFPDFAQSLDTAKLPGVVRKTWNKMSEEARQAALTIDFPESVRTLLTQALATP